jgi:hypothetical protein
MQRHMALHQKLRRDGRSRAEAGIGKAEVQCPFTLTNWSFLTTFRISKADASKRRTLAFFLHCRPAHVDKLL